MADDPDDPWRPGSSVDMVPSSGSWSFDPLPVDSDPSDPPSPARRLLTVAAVLAALAIVAAVVAAIGSSSPSTATPTETTVPPSRLVLPAPDQTLAEEDRARLVDSGEDVILAGGDVPISMGPSECLHRRLPASVEPRWSVDIVDALAVSGSVVVAADVAVVPVVRSEGDQLPDIELVALDVGSGEERWRTAEPTAGAPGLEYLGVVGDVVLVANARLIGDDGRTLTGLSTATGEVLWEYPMGPFESVESLRTSRFAVLRSFGETRDVFDPSTTVIDLDTGRSSRFDGWPVHIDDESGLLVTTDEEVVYGQFLDATFPGRLSVGVDGDQAFTVVGESLVVEGGGDDPLLRRSLDPRAPISVSPLALSGSVRIDPPEIVSELLVLDEASLVVMSDDAVHGANAGENVVEIRWRVAGRLVGNAPSDRGRTLILRRDGGRLQRLLDSSTGRTIFDASSFGNEVQEQDLLANGVILRDGVGADAARVAIDLDGRPMWTLAGSGPLAVGDRVVIDWSQRVNGAVTILEVNAFGREVQSPPSCETATESFQGFPS